MSANARVGIELFLTEEGALKTAFEHVVAELAKILNNVGIEHTLKSITDAAQAASATATKAANSSVDAVEKARQRDIAGLQSAIDKQIALKEKAAAKEKADADKLAADKEKARQREAEASERTSLAEQKASEAAAVASQRYAKLKEEYEGRSLDDIRTKIHAFEQETRTLRQARSTEEDAGVKKALQTRVNAINSELQLYRSLEKEKTGARTFMEQLEKSEEKQAEHLKATWGGVFKNIVTGNGQFVAEIKRVEAEHKASMERMAKAATEEARAEYAAKHAAIEKELADIKHRNEESKEQAGEGGGLAKNLSGQLSGALGPISSMVGPAGIAAGLGAALGGLIEEGKETAERAEQIKIGLMSAGMGAEEAEKALKGVRSAAKDVSYELGVNREQLESATAGYLKLGGPAKDLKKTQEDIAALSVKAGIDMESAGKMLAKATDPENQKNLSKFGINLAGVTDEAERSRIIHEKLSGTLSGMKEAADSPLGGFKRMQQSLSEITESIGSLLFEALGPFFTILGEIGKVISDYVVPVVKVLMNVAIFPLKTGFELLFATIKGWINVVILVWEWIGKVTGVTAALTEAWEYVSAAAEKVVTWFNKAKDTVSNLGSTLTNLLGISSKSEDAAVKLADARKKEREATQDAAKAADDYTASLAKNQEESDKSAKQGQDNAISAIVDIRNKLKSATGAEKALLEERLAQWTSYGKQQAATQEELEKQKHEASLTIGASADKKDNSAEKQAKKDAKATYNAKRQAADDWLNDQKALISLELKTEAEKKHDELGAEVEHAQKILDISGATTKQRIAAQANLHKAQDALRKDDQTKLLNENKADSDDLLAELELRGIRENLNERDIAKERFKIQRQALVDEIALRQSFGEDTAKLERQLASMDAKDAQDRRKLTLEASRAFREIADRDAKSQRDMAIAGMRDEHEKKLAEIKAQNADLLAAEDRHYLEEIEKYKGQQEILDALKQEHANKRVAIEADTSRKMQDEQARSLGEIGAGFANAYKSMENNVNQAFFKPMQNSWFLSKTVAGQALSEILKGVLQFVETWIAKKATMIAMEAIFGATTIATTAATMTGIAATAGPAATAVSIATLGAADAIGASAYIGALAAGKIATQASMKFAKGVVATQPIFSPLFSDGTHSGAEFGEAGPEALIPLHELPGMVRESMPAIHLPQQNFDMSGVESELRATRQAIQQQRLVTQIDQNENILSQQRALNQMNRKL